MVIARPVLLALLFASPLAACASGECDTLESCDIRDHGCQAQVAKVVACLRGSRAVAPQVDVVDADRFIDSQDADAEPLSDDQRDHYRALSLFGLMPAKPDAGQLARDEWSDVAAFFDTDTHRVTVLDRGRALDDSGSVVLLAHELVHAQQSRETKDAFYAAVDESRDAVWAASALVEGEATLYQDQADVLGYGFEQSDIDWPSVYENFESLAWFDASQEPAIYERADSSFSYAFGAAYLSEAYRRGGAREVRKAVRDVPDSTRELSAGYPRHRDPTKFEVESLADVAVPVLPETFVYLSSERAGSYLFESFLVRATGLLPELPDLVKTGMTGDSLSTYRVGTDQVSVFWRLRFVDADHATQAQSWLEPVSKLVVTRDDRDLIVAAISDEAMRDLISGDLTWAAAPAPAVDAEPTDEPKRASQLRCAFRRVLQRGRKLQ